MRLLRLKVLDKSGKNEGDGGKIKQRKKVSGVLKDCVHVCVCVGCAWVHLCTFVQARASVYPCVLALTHTCSSAHCAR